MLVMVVFFIAFRWIHLSTPLIRLFLLVLILLLMPTLNFLPVWFALSLRSEERFSRNAETDLVCRLLLEKKKITAEKAEGGQTDNASAHVEDAMASRLKRDHSGEFSVVAA